jgi:adenylate cyclase
LGARYVIEGSVRKAGNRLRVTAQLINAETGHHVWAERFDRKLEDIFELQDELTQRIAATVAPEVERVEHSRAAKNRTRNLDIWERVHRGMAELYKFSPEGNAAAREIFERAIEIDPDYADAYVGIAWSHIRDFNSAVVGNRDENGRKALAAAQRAVELNPSDFYGHLVLGIGYVLVSEFDKSLSATEMALQLNPNIANGHIGIGEWLSLTGRPEDSIVHFEKALSLNPKDPRNHLVPSWPGRTLWRVTMKTRPSGRARQFSGSRMLRCRI